MINANSRYATNKVIPGKNLAGEDILVILPRVPADVTFSFTWFQVTDDTNVDVLAYNFYGSSTLWWVIANGNPEITNWSSLTPGSLIRIPSLTSAIS